MDFVNVLGNVLHLDVLDVEQIAEKKPILPAFLYKSRQISRTVFLSVRECSCLMYFGMSVSLIQIVKRVDKRRFVGASNASRFENEEEFRFEKDRGFEEISVQLLETLDVIHGKWVVRIKGDSTRSVSGKIFDISNATNPVLIETEVFSIWKQQLNVLLAVLETMQSEKRRHLGHKQIPQKIG